jgi:ATP-dependent DNA ligase
VALLAYQSDEGLSYAGGAFVALKAAERGALHDRLARLTADRSPISALRKHDARWVKPELIVGVRHLRGDGTLRHATVQELRDS